MKKYFFCDGIEIWGKCLYPKMKKFTLNWRGCPRFSILKTGNI